MFFCPGFLQVRQSLVASKNKKCPTSRSEQSASGVRHGGRRVAHHFYNRKPSNLNSSNKIFQVNYYFEKAFYWFIKSIQFLWSRDLYPLFPLDFFSTVNKSLETLQYNKDDILPTISLSYYKTPYRVGTSYRTKVLVYTVQYINWSIRKQQQQQFFFRFQQLQNIF